MRDHKGWISIKYLSVLLVLSAMVIFYAGYITIGSSITASLNRITQDIPGSISEKVLSKLTASWNKIVKDRPTSITDKVLSELTLYPPSGSRNNENRASIKRSFKKIKGIIDGWERMKTSLMPGQQITHLQFIYDRAKLFGVPLEACFLALNESNWKQNAMSGVGAAGPWQIMRTTAKELRLTYTALLSKDEAIKAEEVKAWRELYWRVDERANWEISTNAALEYLGIIYKQTFQWEKTLARKLGREKSMTENDRWLFVMWSYNAGPGRVKSRYLRINGDPDKYYESFIGVSRESAQYVNKIFVIGELVREYERGRG